MPLSRKPYLRAPSVKWFFLMTVNLSLSPRVYKFLLGSQSSSFSWNYRDKLPQTIYLLLWQNGFVLHILTTQSQVNINVSTFVYKIREEAKILIFECQRILRFLLLPMTIWCSLLFRDLYSKVTVCPDRKFCGAVYLSQVLAKWNQVSNRCRGP